MRPYTASKNVELVGKLSTNPRGRTRTKNQKIRRGRPQTQGHGRSSRLQRILPTSWKKTRRAQQHSGPRWNAVHTNHSGSSTKDRKGGGPVLHTKQNKHDGHGFVHEIDEVVSKHEPEPTVNFTKLSYLQNGDLSERLKKFRFLDDYERERHQLLKDPRAPIPAHRQDTIRRMDALLGVQSSARPVSPTQNSTTSETPNNLNEQHQLETNRAVEVRSRPNSSHTLKDAPRRRRSSIDAGSGVNEEMAKLEAAERRSGKWRF